MCTCLYLCIICPHTHTHQLHQILNTINAMNVTTKVAVVGSGISGAVCASTLARNGLSVTVFESARGPGGRMSQRKEVSEDGRELLFDHGAPFFSVSNVDALNLVDDWESKGLVAEWNQGFGSFDYISRKFLNLEQEGLIKRYVGVPGMNSICKALCNETGVESMCGAEVHRLEWLDKENLWTLTGADGKDIGLFKGVVVSDKAMFSPRFTAVTGHPPPLDLNLVPELAAMLKDIPTNPCFALMLAFSEPLSSIPMKGLSFQNSEALSWCHCDSSKPGRSTESERWVLHSTAKYARDVIAQTGFTKPSSEMLTKVADELFQEFWRTGLIKSKPFFRKAHRWTNIMWLSILLKLQSHPFKLVYDSTFCMGSAFPAASIAREEKCIWHMKKRLAICGDFCVSPNVEGAILSGHTAALKLIEAYCCL